MKKVENFNSKSKTLQQDNIFVENSITDIANVISLPCRKGYEQAVISNRQVVNIVSNSYGHLSNESFFLKVEEKLIEADIEYITRSYNRKNRSFAVDYILNDERYIIDVANKKDIIKPMLRFVNSYDGSCKTSGNFGYFRQVCSNGLHITETKLAFAVKHSNNIAEIVLPEIDILVSNFINNEYYTLKTKAEFLSSKIISNVAEFVKQVCNETNIFKFEKSEKNQDASKNAEIVIDTINAEAKHLEIEPNFWLGYNSFNEILHDKFDKTFDIQKNIDNKVFNFVNELANL